MKYTLFLLLFLFPATLFAGDNRIIYPNHQQNLIQRHTVEFDKDTFLGLDGYYGQIDKLKIEAERQKGADKQALLDLIEILKDLIKTNKTATPPPPMPEVEKPQMPEPPKNSDLDKQVFQIFKTNCGNCHNETKSSGNLKLISNGGLYNLSGETRSKVYFRTSGVGIKSHNLSIMPPGKPLKDEDVETLASWAVQKLENNE
jgi:mono/diheme cytochrome c family protein